MNSIQNSSRRGFLSNLLSGGAYMLGAHFAPEGLWGAQTPQSAYTVWPSEPPADCPFRQSTEITGVAFTGRHIQYVHPDTWFPSWASNGNLYSPWADGVVNGVRSNSGGTKLKPSTGHATILGIDPLHLEITDAGLYPGDPTPYGGRYPCGSLVYNGVWYYGTYCLMDSDGDPAKGFNWDILGPFVGFRYSTDYGRTWHDTPHTPLHPLFLEPRRPGGKVKIGSPHFVDFGKNMQYSPDGKAYLVGHGAVDPDPEPRPANLSWITGDQIYMVRVTPVSGTSTTAPNTSTSPGSMPLGGQLGRMISPGSSRWWIGTTTVAASR